MQLKLLQLNIWGATCFPALKEFLTHNDFDVLCFQEVAGTQVDMGNLHTNVDSFKQLTNILGTTHFGELAISQYASSNPENGYFGNAIFYKKDFKLIKKNIHWLYQRDSLFPSIAKSFEEVGRNVLHLTLGKEGHQVEMLTTHLAWAESKEEHPHQREQNKKLIEYMRSVKSPWILTGDFNIDPKQQSVLDLEQLGRDLTKEYHVPNTIDPLNHKKWENIKPGFPIDYIFVSEDIKVEEFRALETTHVSDHLGLVATVEI